MMVLASLVLAACGAADPTATSQATTAATAPTTGGAESPTAATGVDDATATTGTMDATATTEATEPAETAPAETATVGTVETATTEPEETATVGTPGETATTAPTDGAGGVIDPNLSGSIRADGSSTVEPITIAARDEFNKMAKNVKISVGESGTSGGFEKFCAGQTDISNASRPIKPEEVEACKKAGVEFIELPVAFDGIAVMVNPANDFVECLTVKELNMIWGADSEGEITNWNQVREGFPDQDLELYGPGGQSGTFDYFNEAINAEDDEESRSDYNASENDNVIVQGIAGDENALGYFGYAYYQANQGKLKLIAVDNEGNGKCVKPSPQTIQDASYQPLSRPLFIYVAKKAAARPEVKAFVDFYLSEAFTPKIASPQVGYVTLPRPLYEAIDKRFAAGTTGTLFPKGAEVGATLDRYMK